MPTLLTRASRPNQGGKITKDGVTTSYAPSPAGGPSPTRNAGGMISAPLSPGVSMTRTFAPSARSSAAPGRPNAGGTISAPVAPGVGMTRTIAPSPSTMPMHDPSMNAGGSIEAPVAPGVTLQRSFQPTPVSSPQSAVARPAASNAQPARVSPAVQQTEQANPLTGDGGGAGQLEGQSEAVDGDADDVPNLFSSRGAGAPRGDDAMPAGENVGGSGLYARKFSNPKSASRYDQYTRSLFS